MRTGIGYFDRNKAHIFPTIISRECPSLGLIAITFAEFTLVFRRGTYRLFCRALT
jgi:hypothetical protein